MLQCESQRLLLGLVTSSEITQHLFVLQPVGLQLLCHRVMLLPTRVTFALQSLRDANRCSGRSVRLVRHADQLLHLRAKGI